MDDEGERGARELGREGWVLGGFDDEDEDELDVETEEEEDVDVDGTGGFFSSARAWFRFSMRSEVLSFDQVAF